MAEENGTINVKRDIGKHSSKRCGTRDFSEQPKVSGEYPDEKVLHRTKAPLILTPAKAAENKSVL